MTLEGKTPKEIEEAIKKQQYGLIGSKNENPYSNDAENQNA